MRRPPSAARRRTPRWPPTALRSPGRSSEALAPAHVLELPLVPRQQPAVDHHSDKDGSIKASDGETARPLQLHSFGLSELRGAAVGPQLHVPHVFMDADVELRPCDKGLRPCDTQERRPPRGGDSMTRGAGRTSAAQESRGEAADGKPGRLAFFSRREGWNG